MTKDIGGYAYPFHGTSTVHFGMTLRDWFAGQALAGISTGLSADNITELADGIKGGRVIAKAAFALADAMNAERNKP